MTLISTDQCLHCENAVSTTEYLPVGSREVHCDSCFMKYVNDDGKCNVCEAEKERIE